MEKNQHNNNTASTEEQNDAVFTGNQPGQQLPDKTHTDASKSPSASGETVEHSESSFPKEDNETLGTP